MKQNEVRKTAPLGDAKLERLATLLGEFLAKAWMKQIRNKDIQSKGLPVTSPDRLKKRHNIN